MSIFNAQKQQDYWNQKEEAFQTVKDIHIVPQLIQSIPKKNYLCVTPEEALTELLTEAQIIATLGAYFGDESKGKVNNRFALLLKYICELEHKPFASFRLNSGSNTGRTTFLGNNKLVWHLVPSAIVYGIDSFIGPDCVGDLVSLFDEEITPYSNVVDFSHLKLGNFFLTLPYHRIMDVLGSAKNSSTGVGIKQTYMSVKNKTCPRLDDLFNGTRNLERTIEKDMEIYRGFLKERGWDNQAVQEQLQKIRTENKRVVPDHVLEFVASLHSVKYLADTYQQIARSEIFPQRVDVPQAAQEILQQGGRINLETTQSYYLSNKVDQGYKYSTSADTTLTGCLASLDLLSTKYKIFAINVNKTPGTSRVGIGNIPGCFTFQDRFSSEGIDSLDKFDGACLDYSKIQELFFNSIQPNGLILPNHYCDESGEYEIGEAMAITCSRKYGEKGSTTGKPRITGLYDAVFQAQLAQRQGVYEFISAMDRGDDCNCLGLVVAHIVSLPIKGDFSRDKDNHIYLDSNGKKYYSGDIIPAGEILPSSSSGVTNYCLPIIKKIPGWKGISVHDLKPGDRLPEQVADFITTANYFTKSKTLGIGTGPKEEDMLFFKEV